MIDIKLKGINKVRKKLASGETRTFYYHRATNKRLPDNPNSPEFLREYAEAQEAIKSTGRNKGTFKAIIQSYMASPAYKDKRERTRKDYQRQIVKIEDEFGVMPIAVLDDRRVRSDFLAWRDRLAKQSKKQADYAITVLGVILSWAVDRGLISVNRAARPGKLYRSDRAAIVWTDDDVAAFLGVASPELALALMLAKNTGQRQGDLLKLTWAAYDGSYIRLTQSKTGAKVVVPVTHELKKYLQAEKMRRKGKGVDATAVLTRPDGQPWRTDHFRHEWRAATLAAGLDGKRFQDLRGTTATALADAGCTAFEIASITGHSPKSVEAILEHYLTRSQAQAENAIVKLENAKRTKTANRAANQGQEG